MKRINLLGPHNWREVPVFWWEGIKFKAEISARRTHRFWGQATASRNAGFPLWWSIRTAWQWRKGPTPELRRDRDEYVRMKGDPQ